MQAIIVCNFKENLSSRAKEMAKKTNFGPNLVLLSPNSDRQFLFSKIWLRQSLDIMVSYHHVQCQKKFMIQSWEKLVTYGRTNWQTGDESDFIRSCPTKVKRPLVWTSWFRQIVRTIHLLNKRLCLKPNIDHDVIEQLSIKFILLYFVSYGIINMWQKVYCVMHIHEKNCQCKQEIIGLSVE